MQLEEALNALREQREQEIREMNDRIINLHEEMAGLRVKVSLLEEENQRLRSENGSS
jgi:regulator of replication initiation timing